jgi:steroid delta-isomerase
MTHDPALHARQPPGHPPSDERVLRVVAFFESLTPASLSSVPSIYSEAARFIDPFNDVTGRPAITRVFTHMFEQLHEPRFEVLQTIAEGDHGFLLWNFHFARQAGAPAMRVHGGSHVHFDPDGRIDWHRDHWDPAREIYETVPLLGAVLRWLRRRLQA